jgi:hypothetical protein
MYTTASTGASRRLLLELVKDIEDEGGFMAVSSVNRVRYRNITTAAQMPLRYAFLEVVQVISETDKARKRVTICVYEFRAKEIAPLLSVPAPHA